jgi:hypothetical protein
MDVRRGYVIVSYEFGHVTGCRVRVWVDIWWSKLQVVVNGASLHGGTSIGGGPSFTNYFAWN